MNSPERVPLVCVNEDSGTEQPEVVLDPEDARWLGLALVQAAVESRAVRIVLLPEVTPELAEPRRSPPIDTSAVGPPNWALRESEAGRSESRIAGSARSPQAVAARLVGLDEPTGRAVAEERDCGFRVVQRDGVSLPVTMDARSNRINATVENGRVTAVEVR